MQSPIARFRGRWPRLGVRKRIVVLGIAAGLLLPGLAVASHIFADVPDAHTFHGNIANLANAGITSGCTPTTYCPDQAVTRGQMAAFLNRGLGRIAEADFLVAKVGNDSDVVATMTIKPGISPAAIAGANMFVRVEVTGTLQPGVLTGCPCSLGISVTVNNNPVSAYATGASFSAAGYIPYSAVGVVEIEGAVDSTVSISVYAISGFVAETSVSVYGNVNAEIFPFGSGGTDTLGATSVSASNNPLAAQGAE